MAMTVNEFVGYEVESFGRWGRSVYKYTDCGPWVVAITPDGQEHYYEHEGYDLKGTDLIDGVNVGSIVEGWDAGGLGPIFCQNRQEFDEALERISKAADVIWSICNSDNFQIIWDKEWVGYACCEEWSYPKIEWDDPEDPESYPPAKVRRKLYRYLRSGRYMSRKRPGQKKCKWGYYSPQEHEVFKITDRLSIMYFEREIWAELDDMEIISC